jgi:hypothetical protein
MCLLLLGSNRFVTLKHTSYLLRSWTQEANENTTMSLKHIRKGRCT